MFLNERDEKDIPCESCIEQIECGKKSLECVAVRNWYYNGTYDNKDINRLKRKIKVFK